MVSACWGVEFCVWRRADAAAAIVFLCGFRTVPEPARPTAGLTAGADKLVPNLTWS